MSAITAFIERFVAECMVIADGNTCLAQDVVAKWVAYNGSTRGKCKLYAHIKSIQGVEKVGTTYYGIKLADATIEETADETIHGISFSSADMTNLTAYQRMMLKLEMIKLKNVAEQNAIERAKVEATIRMIDIEDRRIDIEAATRLAVANKQIAVKREQMALAERLHIEQLSFMTTENNTNRKMYHSYSRYYDQCINLDMYGNPSYRSFEKDAP